MAKTIWLIIDETNNTKTEFTYYHFGKDPKFPTWYMEENHSYTIEMLWNITFSKTLTFKVFFKCLTHYYSVK